MVHTNQLPSLEGPGVGSQVRLNLERCSGYVTHLKHYGIIHAELICAPRYIKTQNRLSF